MNETKMYEINQWGTITSSRKPKNWKKDWEVLTDSGDYVVLQSKQTYFHEDETDFGEFNFSYKYLITINCDFDNNIDYIELFMVPDPQAIKDKKLQDYLDVLENICCPLLERTKIRTKKEWTESRKTISCLNKSAVCILGIDGFRGFYLDKYQSRIGATGWDYLKEAIYGRNKYDSALEAIKRYEEEMKGEKKND